MGHAFTIAEVDRKEAELISLFYFFSDLNVAYLNSLSCKFISGVNNFDLGLEHSFQKHLEIIENSRRISEL